MSASLLSQGTSGWRRMVPVDEQGASSSTASNGPRFATPAHRRRRVSACSASRVRFSRRRPSRAGERSTAVTRAPAKASCAVLPPGAAHRSATALPRTSPKQARRQRGGGVLHPPGAFAETGQQRDRALREGAHGSGRQHAPAQTLGPGLGIVFDGEIERGLMAVGLRDRARGVGAVAFAPARQQPFRRVARRRMSASASIAALRHAAQHRVDQPGVARGAAVGLRQAHRQIDRGMIGHFEPEDLRGADQQDGFDARRVGGKTLVEKSAEQVAQGAEPPQHGRDEPAHQRAVAVGERGQAGMGGLAGQLLVERGLPPQDAVENVGGDPSGGEAGDFRLRRGARTRHVPIIAMNCGLDANPREKTSPVHRFKPAAATRYGSIVADDRLEIGLTRIACRWRPPRNPVR